MKYNPLTNIRYLVVHCAATPPDMDIGAKEIDLWHRQRGFFSIGYHAVIRRDGRVESGRPLDVPGAHAAGYNQMSLGVCLVGGIDKAGPHGKGQDNFTPDQYVSLAGLLQKWKKLHPDAEIVGHRDLISRHDRLKECPSFDVKTWLKEGKTITVEEYP